MLEFDATRPRGLDVVELSMTVASRTLTSTSGPRDFVLACVALGSGAESTGTASGSGAGSSLVSDCSGVFFVAGVRTLLTEAFTSFGIGRVLEAVETILPPSCGPTIR